MFPALNPSLKVRLCEHWSEPTPGTKKEGAAVVPEGAQRLHRQVKKKKKSERMTSDGSVLFTSLLDRRNPGRLCTLWPQAWSIHSLCPREGFPEHKSGPVTPLFNILQWLPLAHSWIQSSLSCRTLPGPSSPGLCSPGCFSSCPHLSCSSTKFPGTFFLPPTPAHLCLQCPFLPFPT